jgi:F420H(2)-dependent quinone reductase
MVDYVLVESGHPLRYLHTAHQTRDMAYLKPPWFVRKIFNRVAMATGVGNSQTLTVTKRVSKEPQQIPVVVPEVGGVKYLVSTRGEAEWVRNVRADPNVKLGDTKYVAREVPVEERAPVIAAYRPLAGKVVESYWKELPNDADHPTFALTPG